MNYITDYFYENSTYKIQNVNNIFNFIIEILKISDEETKKKIIEIMKIQIGMTFTNNFKMYLFRKLGSNDLLELF